MVLWCLVMEFRWPGKHFFLKARRKNSRKRKKKLFAWDRFKPEHAKINGFDFHYTDFGAFTNPVERKPDYLGRPRKEWMWTTCGYPFGCSSEKPALYLFEHPSLPHLLLNQGIVVILGHPLELFYMNIYVKAYRLAMEEILTGRKTRDEIILSEFEKVMYLSEKLYRAKIYDPVYIETGDERYIGFILTSRYPGHSDLFLNFRKKAAEAKLICG